MEITNVAIEKLRPSEHQPPERTKDVASLAESIKAIGIMIPLLVRPAEKGKHEIIGGHRRLAAAWAIGLKELPCVIVAGDADDAQIKRMAENMQRVNLTPMQEAANIQALTERKWDFPKIAAELGMTPQYLARRAKLLDLSPEWLKALNDPKQEWTRQWNVQALELVARYSHAHQNKLLNEFHGYMPEMDELRDAISEGEHELKLAAWDLNDEVLLPGAGSCNACPKRSGCQPLLFDDLAEGKKTKPGDRCLDIACWDKKRQAHVARARAKILKDHPQIVSVSTEKDQWQLKSDHQTGVLARGTFKKVKEGEKGAVPAIPIDGPKAGDLIWITKNKEGVFSRTASAKKSTADKKPITDAERKQRLLNRRNMHIIQQILEHINKSKEPAGLLKMKADEQIKRAFCATMTFGFQNVVYGGSWPSFERACAANISALIPDWWKRYKQELHRVVVCYNGDEASQRVKSFQPLLDILGLSADELQKKAAGEIPDRHGLLSGKKTGTKVADIKEDKTPAGLTNDNGVFVTGVQEIKMPAPRWAKKLRCRVLIARAKDLSYRAGYEFHDGHGTGGATSPCINREACPDRKAAITLGVQLLLNTVRNTLEVTAVEISKKLTKELLVSIPKWCEQNGITIPKTGMKVEPKPKPVREKKHGKK